MIISSESTYFSRKNSRLQNIATTTPSLYIFTTSYGSKLVNIPRDKLNSVKVVTKEWRGDAVEEMRTWRGKDLSLIGFSRKRATNHHGDSPQLRARGYIHNDVAISLMAKNIYILYATWLDRSSAYPLSSSVARLPSHLLNKLGCPNLASPRTPRRRKEKRRARDISWKG